MNPTQEIPESTEVKSWADYYEAPYTLPEIYRHLSNMGLFIDKCTRHFPGKRILEIGTGTGLMCVYFSQMGYRMCGLDYDYGIVAKNQHLKKTFNAELQFMQGDMFDLPFAPGAFDACYHQGLMEHFDEPDILRALEHQTSVCKRVIFTVPTRHWKGGVRGDERMWNGTYWRELLKPFRIVDIFGGAYTSLATRGLHFLERKVAKGKPAFLFQNMALHRAGDLGFVIEKP